MNDLLNSTARLLSEKVAARDETITALRRELLLARNDTDVGVRPIVGSICPACHRVEMVPVEGYVLTLDDDPDLELCEECQTA